jgi:hypothetical protein
MSLTLRTDAELDEAIEAIAAAKGLSKQEAIRQTMIAEAARLGLMQQGMDSYARMKEAWGPVLTRLGES